MPATFDGTNVFPVSDVEIAFPAVRAWFTPMADIPAEHRKETPWVRIFRDVSFGVKPGARLRLLPRQDVNAGNVHSPEVMRMIECVMGCRGIQHEHKEALVSFIFASFFSHGWFEGEEPSEIRALLHSTPE